MKISEIVEKVVGDIGDKRRWRDYRARVQTLPPADRSAVQALERYLLYFGAVRDSDTMMSMLEDLLDLFEQSVADGTSIHGILGEDPVQFAEEFIRTYGEAEWVAKERARLTDAIQSAAAEEGR